MRLALVCASASLSRGRNMLGTAAIWRAMPAMSLTGWVTLHTRHIASRSWSRLFWLSEIPLPRRKWKQRKEWSLLRLRAWGSLSISLGRISSLIRTLRGLTNKFGTFNDEEFDEAGCERHLASNPALAIAGVAYWTLKAEARFFAGDYASAVDASSNAQQLLWAAPALLEQAAFRFYGALSHAGAWDSASPDERQNHFEAL